MSTKKKITAAAAAALIAALLIGGAFAWTDFTQAFTNIFHNHPEPDVLLHDDFTQNKNKDVYVENTGNTPVYVRIAFYEYLQVGNKVIVGDTSKTPAEAVKDKSTYEKHLWDPMPDASGVQSKWNLPSDQYYDWYVTGAQKLYLPGTSEMGDPSFAGYSVNTTPTAEDGGNGNALKYTAPTIPVKTMAWWSVQDAAVKRGYKGWILDTDGYAYWSQKLAPGAATNLLLDNVLPKTGITPDDNSYYAIDVRMQAANSTEVYKMYTDEATGKHDASDDAITWLDLDSKEPAQNPDLNDKINNAKGDGLTDAEIAALKAALEASPVDTDGITAIGIDNAKKAYGAAQAAQDALNEELNKPNPDADMVEQLARAAQSLEALGDRITDQCTDGQLDAGDAVTVDGNGFAKVVDASGNTLLNSLNFPDPGLLSVLQNGLATTKYNVGYNLNPNTLVSDYSNINSTNYDQLAIAPPSATALSQSELEAVTELYMNNSRIVGAGTSYPHDSHFITSVEGIELFPNLKVVQARGFEIDSFSAPNNPQLISIALNGSGLASVDLTHNPNLEELSIDSTSITRLNLSQNPKLKAIWINLNPKLTSLDFNANADLETANLNNNVLLKSLNLNGLTGLKYLSATNTGMSSLDVSPCAALETLTDSWTVTTPAPAFGPLTSLNIAGLANLKTLTAVSQGFTSLDVSGCTSLTTISLFVSGTADWYGALGHGPLSTISNLSDCIALARLDVYSQSLTSLNCDGATALTYINAANNNLSSISFAGCPLTTLRIENTADIRPIDPDGPDAIKNHILSLDVSMLSFTHTNTNLRIQNNGMTSLKVPATGSTLLQWQGTPANNANTSYHLTGNNFGTGNVGITQ